MNGMGSQLSAFVCVKCNCLRFYKQYLDRLISKRDKLLVTPSPFVHSRAFFLAVERLNRSNRTINAIHCMAQNL